MTISVLFLYLVSIAAASPRALVPCSVAHPLPNAQPGVDACASAAPRTPIPPSSVNPATVARILFLADMMSFRFDSSSYPAHGLALQPVLSLAAETGACGGSQEARGRIWPSTMPPALC